MIFPLSIILLVFLVHHLQRIRYWVILGTLKGARLEAFMQHNFRVQVLGNQHWLGLMVCSMGALSIPHFPFATAMVGVVLWQLIFSPFRSFIKSQKRSLAPHQRSTFYGIAGISLLWISILALYVYNRSNGLMWGIFLLGLLVIDVLIPYFILLKNRKR
jgi:hypothetical protein